MLVYKVLGEDGEACHGGSGRWHLPKNGKPGKWMQVKGEIVPCENGLHLCRKDDLIYWIGPTIWVAEYEGDPVVESDKIVVRKARLVAPTNWNARSQRLFAADCATHAVQQLRRRGIEPDSRSLDAIRVARRHAVGKATDDELAAAQAAAWAAAWDAAWAAAQAAAWAAAWDAARAAAQAAAWAAAWDAARAAAWAAARVWQTKRLFHYLSADAR